MCVDITGKAGQPGGGSYHYSNIYPRTYFKVLVQSETVSLCVVRSEIALCYIQEMDCHQFTHVDRCDNIITFLTISVMTGYHPFLP